MKAVVHCFLDEYVIETARFFFLPTKKDAEQAFLLLRIKENRGSIGTSIVYAIPMPERGENHYDLVGEDGEVGLLPWRDGKPDSTNEMLRHQMDFIEPTHWHPGITVRQTSHNMGIGAVPIIQIIDEQEQIILLEWSVGRNYVKVRGNRHIVAPNGLEGRPAIEAMIAGLQLIMQRMDELSVQ